MVLCETTISISGWNKKLFPLGTVQQTWDCMYSRLSSCPVMLLLDSAQLNVPKLILKCGLLLTQVKVTRLQYGNEYNTWHDFSRHVVPCTGLSCVCPPARECCYMSYTITTRVLCSDPADQCQTVIYLTLQYLTSWFSRMVFYISDYSTIYRHTDRKIWISKLYHSLQLLLVQSLARKPMCKLICPYPGREVRNSSTELTNELNTAMNLAGVSLSFETARKIKEVDG